MRGQFCRLIDNASTTDLGATNIRLKINNRAAFVVAPAIAAQHRAPGDFDGFEFIDQLARLRGQTIPGTTERPGVLVTGRGRRRGSSLNGNEGGTCRLRWSDRGSLGIDPGIGSRPEEQESDKPDQDEPNEAGEASPLLGMNPGGFVELEGVFIVAKRGPIQSVFIEQRARCVVPLVDDRRMTVGEAPDVQMPIDKPEDMPVHVETVLSQKHEIDAHVPMGVERLHIGRDARAIRTGRPRFLKLVKDDEGAGLRPLMPVMKAAGSARENPITGIFIPFPCAIRVDQLMIEEQTIDVGEHRTGMHDSAPLVIINGDL